MTTEAPSHEEPEARSDNPRWTTQQRELFEELSALSPELGGIYSEGIRLMGNLDTPGVCHLLGHVGRELMLGVVDAVLQEGWSFPQAELEAVPDDEKHREKIARSLGLSPSDLKVIQLFELHRAFQRTAHYRRGNAPPDPQRLRVSFERLEQLLYGLVGPYFQTQAELDELLSVSDPGPDHLEQLQAVLLRPQQRRYFYERLSHVGWVRPLCKIGAFDRPPDRRIHSDGSWQAVAWPEGEFLARVATSEQELIVETLAKIPPTLENPAVWRVVAAVAATAEPDLGRRLAGLLAKAAESVTTVLFADSIVKLIAVLGTAKHPEAFDLTKALLRVPNADEVGDIPKYSSRSDWVFSRLRWTQFSEFAEQALPRLEESDQERTLAFMLRKLSHISAVARKLDLSTSFRPNHSSDSHDVIGQLVAAIDGIVKRFALVGPENAKRALELVAQHQGDPFERLRYQIIAAAGQHLCEELDEVLSSSRAVEPDDWGREIALILREQYSNASEVARRIFRYALERGPTPESIRFSLQLDGNELPSPEDMSEIKGNWQRRRLNWFRGEIPDGLRELAERLGCWGIKPSVREQELAEVGFYSGGGGWGEARPVKSDELGESTSDEIAQLIREWRPEDSSHERGTTRGFELSLQEMAAKDPAKGLAVWEQAKDAALGFAVSLLNGLKESLREEQEADWPSLVGFAGWAVERALSSGDLRLSTRQALLRSAVDLVEEGCQQNLLPLELEPELWKILSAAITDPVTWDEEEEEFTSFFNLLTAALNRIAPRTVQGALHAGLWSYRMREGQSPDDISEAVESLLSPVLDEVLVRKGAGRVLAEAIIGQFLPQLQLIAPKWLESHLGDLLDLGATLPFQHPAWGGYVTRARLYDSTFTLIRPWYAKGVEGACTTEGRKTSDGDHWSLTRSLAEHVLVAFLRGLVSFDEDDRLVELTFENVPAEDRGAAYWSVFRAWSDADKAPFLEMINRLISFWKWRLDELEALDDEPAVVEEAQGLGWFLRTPYLPDKDVVELGVRTAKAAKGSLEHIPWEQMVELAESDVDGVYEIAESVLMTQAGKTPWYIPVEEIKPVLHAVLSRGTPDTQARARRLINRLGEAGLTAFGDLLGS